MCTSYGASSWHEVSTKFDCEYLMIPMDCLRSWGWIRCEIAVHSECSKHCTDEVIIMSLAMIILPADI